MINVIKQIAVHNVRLVLQHVDPGNIKLHI
jgi:hypothetical protein